MASAQCAVSFTVCVLMIKLLLARKDYYDMLGIHKDATERQIKKAFHRLAMKYHPDKNKSPDAEVKFREIAEAYETLSDETRRREYNQFGDTTAYFTEETQGKHKESVHQPSPFNFDDFFNNFDIYSQNRHRLHRRHFDEHSRSRKDFHGKHKRNFPGDDGAGIIDDIFDDIEKIFTFNGHSQQPENRFHSASKQHCRKVTERRGNMVTTYTDCTTP